MEKPILIIMAAGLGSRFGGLKQIAPVDPFGHILMDYSIFDARRAGFERVIFVINPDLESEFRQAVGERISKYMDVGYAYQRITDLPTGFSVPEGRTKPWGTAHAVRAAKDMVSGPFAVINADDYYGESAYKLIYDFLSTQQDDACHAMVGYNIENTLTENGYVSRGICQMDSNGFLQKIIERTHVEIRPGGAAFTENGTDFTFIPERTTVSPSFMLSFPS
jgi:NDP-sugar pyrophosphorylase family protein